MWSIGRSSGRATSNGEHLNGLRLVILAFRMKAGSLASVPLKKPAGTFLTNASKTKKTSSHVAACPIDSLLSVQLRWSAAFSLMPRGQKIANPGIGPVLGSLRYWSGIGGRSVTGARHGSSGESHPTLQNS